MAGMLTVALATPNAIKMLESFGISPKNRQREIIRRAQTRLVAQGFLAKNRNGYLRLTAKGQDRLEYWERNSFEKWKQTIPKRWDKKWRILIFDIQEERKLDRDYIRRTLEHIGFVPLQRSVFIYPYDCEDLVALIKAEFKIGHDLIYIIADAVENDGSFREYFNLPHEE